MAVKKIPSSGDVVELAETGGGIMVDLNPSYRSEIAETVSVEGPAEVAAAETALSADEDRIALLYVEERVARSHHCVNGRQAVSSQHLCSGSMCMAWRYADTDLVGYETHGYCGLAGDPAR